MRAEGSGGGPTGELPRRATPPAAWAGVTVRSRAADADVVERARFVGRTVRELCGLLQAGAPYPEIVERLERARGALESIRVTLWHRELVRTLGGRTRRAA